MEDFPYIGEPAGLVLSRLGLPQDTLIKIRRKLCPGILRQMSMSLEENASLGFPASTLYSSSGKEGAVHQQQEASANAIMGLSQKTFKAECMYSYRIRAESLWGTGTTDEEQKGSSLTNVTTGADVSAPSAPPARTSARFFRKRSVSDADAPNLSAGQKLQTPAADARSGIDGAAVAGNGDGGPLSGLVEGETYTDIFPVSAAEPIQAGDVLFMSCAQACMIDFQAVTVSQGLKGLKFLDVSALDLPGHGTEFFEIVLSDHNHFVGRSARRDNAEFASYYSVSVVAVRRRGQATATNPASMIPAAPLQSSVHPSTANGISADFKSRPALDIPEVCMEDAPEVFLEEGVEPALNPSSRVVSPSGSTSQVRTHRTGSSVSAARSRTFSRGRVGGWGMSRSPLRRSRGNTGAQEDEKEKDVTESSFKAGDVVLVLAKEEFIEKYGSSKDFFLVTKVGSVPKPVRYFDYLPLLAFLGMLIWVLLDAEMVS